MRLAITDPLHFWYLRLHTAVSNHNLVKLFSYFEDNNFVYIILELCRKRWKKHKFLFVLETFYHYQESDGAAQEEKSDH